MMRATRTYNIGELQSQIEALGYSCKRVGQELDVDFDGSGHRSYHLSPSRGCWIGNGRYGQSGTIARLLFDVQGGTSIPSIRNIAPAAKIYKDTTKDTTQAARRIWASAKAPKGGYPDDLVDPFEAYMKSRGGLDTKHLLDSCLVRLTKPSKRYDSDQIHAGAVVMVVEPMERQGGLVGIQRLYLTQHGEKVKGFYQSILDPTSWVQVPARKMLGRHGEARITPPAGSIAVPLPGVTGPALSFGEGFESVYSVVQSAGIPGIVCYDATGVVAWARAMAADAKLMTEEQRAKLPTYLGLVDRDASQAGQRATSNAVQILREAGLSAIYCEPPSTKNKASMAVMDASPKGADWNDALIQLGIGGCAAALVESITHSEEWMPKVAPQKPEENRTPAEIFLNRPWHKSGATESTLHVEAVSAEIGRNILSRGVDHLVRKYASWLEKLRDKEKGSRNPEFSPELFQVTTGAGKSTILRGLIHDQVIREAGGACLVLVPDHSQADSYYGWYHYYGRNPDPKSPGYCPNFDEMMESVQKGHIPQNSFCHKCPNGLKWAIEYYGDDYPKGQEALEKLRKQGKTDEDIEKIVACEWQNHLRSAQRARFLVAPFQSFSETLAIWANINVDIHRLVLVDERVDLSKGVKVGLQDLDIWAKRTADQIQLLEKTYDSLVPTSEAEQKEKDTLKKSLDSLYLAQKLFPALAQNLAKFVGKCGKMEIGDDLYEYCKSIVALSKGETAPWEQIEFSKDGHLNIAPLRACFAIAQTLQHGDGFVDDASINVAAINPILERIGKRPIAFFDATPAKLTEDVILSNNGSITKSVIQQNVRIFRHPQRFWGLTPFHKNSDERYRNRVIQKYKILRSIYADSAFLTHKKAHESIHQGAEDYLHGHWGAHHRAHDVWAGRNIVIVGSFFPPQSSWRQLYQADRLAALSAGVDPELWPAWPDKLATEIGAWVDEGGTEVQSRHPLPSDPHIRAWLLANATSETVQAIGRARAVNCDREITVRIFGGLPLSGLEKYGLAVAEYQDDPQELGRTVAQSNQAQSEAATLRYNMAVAGVLSEGQGLSRRVIADWQKAHGLRETSPATYTKITGTPLYKDFIRGCTSPAADILATLDVLFADAVEVGVDLASAARGWLTRDPRDISSAEMIAILIAIGSDPPEDQPAGG